MFFEAMIPMLLFVGLLVFVVFYKEVACRFWLCPDCNKRGIRRHKDKQRAARARHECGDCGAEVLKHHGRVVTIGSFASERLAELEKFDTLTLEQRVEQMLLQAKVRGEK